MRLTTIKFIVLVLLLLIPVIITAMNGNGDIESVEIENKISVVVIEIEEERLTEKEQLMKSAGIAREDWEYADYIIQKESEWRHLVWNYEGSGAYGLCQTMLNLHGVNNDTFKNDPLVQMKWCHEYAQKRYGGWKQAKDFWQINMWW